MVKNKFKGLNTTLLKNLTTKITELKAAKEMYSLAMQGTTDGLWDWNLITNEVYFSEPWKKMLGYKPDELKNDFSTWVKLLHPEDKTRATKYAQDFVKSGGKNKFEMEFRMKHKNGQWVYILARAFMQKDSKGRPIRMVGTHVDLTEKIKQKQKIKEQNTFLNSIFDSMTDPFYVIDVNTHKILRSNLNLSKNKKPKCYCVTHKRKSPCNSKEHPCPLKIMKKTKKSVTVEHIHFVNGDKRIIQVNAYPIFDEKGKLVQMIEQSIDITEQRKSQQKYTQLFNSSRDAIMTLSPPNWTFTSGNKATIEMFNTKTEKKFTSLGPWDVSPEYQPDGQKSTPKAKKMIMKAIKEGSNFFEWTHKKYKGKNFPATVLLTRVNTPDGKMFIQATVRDITKQKTAEEKLTMFKKFAETSNQGMGWASLDGTIQYLNPELCRIFGEKTPKDSISKNVGSYYPKSEGIRLAKEIFPTVLKKGSWSGELVMKKKDGSLVPTMNHLFIICDEKSKPKYFANTLTDISEQKKKENEILTAKENYELLFNTMSGEILIIDKNGKIKDMNTAMAKLSGYKDKQDLFKKTKNPLDMVIPEEHKKLIKGIKNTFKKGYDTNRYHLIKKNKTLAVVDVDAKISKDSEGEPISVVNVKDITKQDKLQKELEQEKEKFQSFFQKFPNIVQSVNLDGSINYVNDSWRKLLGYSNKEIKKLKIWQIIRKDQLPFCQEEFKQLMKGKSLRNVRTVFVSKKGKDVPVLGDISVVKEKGKVVETIAIFRRD